MALSERPVSCIACGNCLRVALFIFPVTRAVVIHHLFVAYVFPFTMTDLIASFVLFVAAFFFFVIIIYPDCFRCTQGY